MLTKAALLAQAFWNDSPTGHGGTLYFVDRMKLHIKDQETWEKWKTDADRNVPQYCILNYLYQSTGDDMELKCPDERYKVGETVIVENISTDGARILVTKEMQAEFAFAATLIDVVAFSQTDFIMQGSPYEGTHYCYDLPKNYLKNMLYPFVPPIPQGNTKCIGDMAVYNPELKAATLYTANVIRAKKETRSPFNTIYVTGLTGGLSIHVGKGFETTGMLGIAMEVSDTGVITQWRELWNQAHFTRNYPHVLKSLRPFSVLETDKERTDHVRPEHIRRVFNVMPAALAGPQDMHGR